MSDRLRGTLGVPSQVLPMCDKPVRTLVHTDEGDLPFQHYFVRRRCEPVVLDLWVRRRVRRRGQALPCVTPCTRPI